MNFITLTKRGGTSILINPMMITAVDILPVVDKNEPRTTIYTMGGASWCVMEAVEDIKKKIKVAESFTITNHI